MECLELRKEFMCKMDEVDTQVVWVFTQLFATILEECLVFQRRLRRVQIKNYNLTEER